MRILDTSAISNTNGMPYKSGTFTHLQLAYKEAIAAVMRGLVGTEHDFSKVYVLNGIINSGTGDDYNISPGTVFYNGEMFLLNASVFTATAPNVPVFNIQTNYFSAVNADPVTFTDGTPRNVHQIRIMTITAGLSGSGVGNYTDRRKANPRLPFSKNPEMYTGSLTDFDAAGIGVTADTMGYALCDGQGGRYDMRGLFVVGAKSGDADFPAAGNTGGSKTKNLAHDHTVSNKGWGSASGGAESGKLLAGPNDGGASNSANGIVSGGAGSATQDILPPYFCVLYVVRIY